MNVTYRDVDFESPEDCALLARWNNDPALKHLFNRFPDEASYAADFTAQQFQRRARERSTKEPFRTLMVLVDGAPVGQAHFEIDTPRLLQPNPHTAWFGLMIGETRLRGLGLGRRIVGHLEELAANAGATQVEIGVFAYNERSLRFFEHLGYVEFARIPERAWWAGQLWEDIRLSKSL